MAGISFDDLVPAAAPAQGASALAFDDLIPNPTAAPSQGTDSPLPAAADTPVSPGGTAGETVYAAEPGGVDMRDEWGRMPPDVTAYKPGIVDQIADLFGIGASNKARSANELAARRIAKEQKTSIDSVYQAAGGSRPMFNPEGRPVQQAAPEAAGVIADQVPQIPAAAANTILRAVRGGDIKAKDDGFVDWAIKQTDTPDQKIDKNYTAFGGIGQSLGYSMVTMVSAATASAAGNLVAPGVGLAAGFGASAGISYRASKDQFLSNVQGKLNKQAQQLYGRELTEDEWNQARQDFDSAATKYGAWEAIPEGVSNLVFLRAFSAPAKGMKAAEMASLSERASVAVKNMAAGAEGKLVSVGTENATETMTGVGQNRAELEAGLTQDELSIRDAFKQQFLPTMLTMGVMAGSMKAKQLAEDFYREKVEPVVAPGSALGRAIQADLDSMAFNPEANRQQVVQSLNPDNAQIMRVPVSFDDLVPPGAAGGNAGGGEDPAAAAAPEAAAPGEFSPVEPTDPTVIVPAPPEAASPTAAPVEPAPAAVAPVEPAPVAPAAPPEPAAAVSPVEPVIPATPAAAAPGETPAAPAAPAAAVSPGEPAPAAPAPSEPAYVPASTDVHPPAATVLNSLMDVSIGQYQGQKQVIKDWQAQHQLAHVVNNDVILTPKGEDLMNALIAISQQRGGGSTAQADAIVRNFLAAKPQEPAAQPAPVAPAPAAVSPAAPAVSPGEPAAPALTPQVKATKGKTNKVIATPAAAPIVSPGEPAVSKATQSVSKATPAVSPGEPAAPTSSELPAELAKWAETLPAEDRAKLDGIWRKADGAGIVGQDRMPKSLEHLYQTYRRLLGEKSAEEANKALDGTVDLVDRFVSDALTRKASALFLEKFGKHPTSESQIKAAVKNGALDISGQPWAPLWFEINKVDPAKIKKAEPQQAGSGLTEGAQRYLDNFRAGVFKLSYATAANSEGRKTAEEMNKQASKDYAAAAKVFLEEELTAKTPGNKDDSLSLEFLSGVTPKPIEKKVALAKNPEQVKKAMFTIAAKGDIRYYLNGIKFDPANDRILASDGHRLVALTSADVASFGEIAPGMPQSSDAILGRDGKWIDGKFPDLERVMPLQNVNDKAWVFDAKAVGDYARALVKVGKYAAMRFGAPVSFEIDGKLQSFNAQYIADLADLFRSFGYDKFNVAIASFEGLNGLLDASSPDGRIRQIVMGLRPDKIDKSPFTPLKPEGEGTIAVTPRPADAVPGSPMSATPKKKRTSKAKKAVERLLDEAGITDPAIADAVVTEYDKLSGEDDGAGLADGRTDGSVDQTGGSLFGDSGQGVQERGNVDAPAGAAADSQQDRQPALFPGNEDRRSAPQNESQGAGAQSASGTVDERTNRSDGNDTGAGEARGESGGQDNGAEKNQRVKGSGSASQFSKASFTDRQSIYRDAFQELGYDPAEAELLPPQRQFEILSAGLAKTFGLALVQKSDRANIRESIDQLLDAYRGMQLMASVLDLPTRAIGLNNTLGLVLTSQGDFLGAYFPQGGGGKSLEKVSTSVPTIGLPGRTNSFGHEWGHALDYYIMDHYSGSVANLSGYVRAGESLAGMMPENVADSFKLLMNSLFFDQAEQSARIMDLERRIEAAAQRGVDATALKAELERLQSGASRSPQGRSEYYQGAHDFGKNPDYWVKPTEMLARSFEAYIAHKIEAAGGSTEFVAKGDYAYLSNADRRLRMTFPKDADRYNIFRAYDLLFDALRADELLAKSGEAAAGLPAGIRLSSPAVYYADQIASSNGIFKSIWQSEKEAWDASNRMNERMAARPKDPRSPLQRFYDGIAPALETNRGVLLSLEARYARTNPAAAKQIREIIRRIATDPGSGHATFSGGTFAEAVTREARRFMTRLSNIQGNNRIDKFSDAELAELADVLTAIDTEGARAAEKIKKAAAPLRELLTDLFYYNRNAGLDIGFVKDQGYLPRLLDEPIVTANQDDFTKDAAKVYKIIFERDTERVTASDDPAKALAALDKRIKEARLSKNDPMLDDYKAARKELLQLLRDLAAAEKAEEDTQDKIDAAQAALDQFMQDNSDIFDEAYNYVRDAWSHTAAADWQTRISYGSPDSFSSHSPAGSFLRERTLPAEADKILAKYYIQDPVDRISRYIHMATRKAEFNRRFGKPAGSSGNTQLYTILQSMIEAGVRKNDREMIEKIVGQVTGTDRSSIPTDNQRLLGSIHAIGQMTLLGRAVLTSLTESMTVGLHTGSVIDSLKSIAMTMQEIFRTGSVKERRELARALGIVSGDLSDEIISNRLGGSTGESAFWQRTTATFFRRTGLTGLTNAQRRTAMQLSGRYVLDLAATLADDSASAKEKGFARDELYDAGVTEDEIDDFVQWAREFDTRLPRHDEVTDVNGQLTDMGQIFAVMTGRLTDQAIQNPSAIDRPYLANTTYGRLTFGLLSFSMAFFRNVVVKQVKKIQREYDKRGAAHAAQMAAMQVLAPLATLYSGHLIISMARELLFNPDKWDEEAKKARGFPIGYLMSLAFSRAGFTGLADPLYNAWTGVKYQRDLSNILGGATGAYFLQAIERIAKFFIVNSDKTNTAERALALAMHELAFQPAVAVATGALPGGAALGTALGLGNAYLSSPVFKNQWKDFFVGKSNVKRRNSKGGW